LRGQAIRGPPRRASGLIFKHWEAASAGRRYPAGSPIVAGIAPATVNKALAHLEQLGIVMNLTAQKRNRLFSCASHIEILRRGTELPGRQVKKSRK